MIGEGNNIQSNNAPGNQEQYPAELIAEFALKGKINPKRQREALNAALITGKINPEQHRQLMTRLVPLEQNGADSKVKVIGIGLTGAVLVVQILNLLFK